MRFAWLTDIHLNFVDPSTIEFFFDSVAATGADRVLISGDIGEAHSVVAFLEHMLARWRRPIDFVLGNHDYYFGSIREVRGRVRGHCRREPLLSWLPESGVVPLSSSTALIGHDGWADARLGDYERSYVMMNDYRLIEELRPYDKQRRWPVLKSLGDEAAAYLDDVLARALVDFSHVYLLTHVPPLAEACWHQGRISDPDWMPHFTCLAVGKVILDRMQAHPDRRLTVLCGHTHGRGRCAPLPNLEILTGGAEYCEPAIERVFEVE